jgi:hypothetical protein
MNRNIAIVLLALAGASSAFADDITIDTTPFVSIASRAEVQAELQQYKQSGVDLWAQNYDQLAGFHGAQSRAQVAAEFLRSRDSAAALVAEDSGSSMLALAQARNASVRVLARNGVNGQ